MSTHAYAESPTGAWYLMEKPWMKRLLYQGRHHRGRGQFNILPIGVAWGVYLFVRIVK